MTPPGHKHPSQTTTIDRQPRQPCYAGFRHLPLSQHCSATCACHASLWRGCGETPGQCADSAPWGWTTVSACSSPGSLGSLQSHRNTFERRHLNVKYSTVNTKYCPLNFIVYLPKSLELIVKCELFISFHVPHREEPDTQSPIDSPLQRKVMGGLRGYLRG